MNQCTQLLINKIKIIKEVIEQEIKKNPLRIYDTILFLSASQGEGTDQDFVLIGDPELIAKHLAIMVHRHEQFADVFYRALQYGIIAENELSKLKPKK